MKDVFKYDNQNSYDDNFRRWFEINSLEREGWGVTPHTREEGKVIFDELFRIRFYQTAHSYKVNKDGILEDVLKDQKSKQKPYVSSYKGTWEIRNANGNVVKKFGKDKVAAIKYLEKNFKKLKAF
jgi:hypothetical protein